MKTRRKVKVLVALIIAVACAFAIAAQGPNPNAESGTPAGTIISVHAEASYLNEVGELITTVSQTVTLTVGAVSGLAVTPDDSVASSTHPPQERITKVFSVCNTGNMADSIMLTSADINAPASLVAFYFDLDGNGLVSAGDTPAVLGRTVSPTFYADRCLGVLAVVDINDTAAGSLLTLHLTAAATGEGGTGGGAEDQGTIISSVGTGPIISSQPPPLMLVDGQKRIAATPGQTLTYSLSFGNTGDTAARNVLVVDQLPANLEYIPDSLVVDTTVLSPQANGNNSSSPNTNDVAVVQVVAGRIEVRLAEVPPGQTVNIRFRARFSGTAIGGAGTINNAVISAENLPTVHPTSDAVVITDPFGVVYAAQSGGAIKISGARVVISTDELGDSPIPLPANSGIAPNGANANPFITGAAGDFNFALSPSQVGREAQTATYFINVIAPGFHRRLLEATLRPRDHYLYDLTVRALDDQPIAKGGSFTLTREAVQLEGLAVLVLNIPVFETANFEITKTADKQRAEIGDTISYRVVAHNALVSTIGEIVIRDRLPASFHYVPGTARIEGAAGTPRAVVEPEIAGNEMLVRLGQLGPGEAATLVYRVRIGANAASGEQFNSVSAEGVFSSDQKISTATARAGVIVGRGIFGMQRAIIGRVFADANSNGEFDHGERPLANVRLYLSNGDSVTTDSEGMYNFPVVNEGSVTISLDPISVFRGYKLLDDGGRAARSWSRLLRTPLGGGALLRQNFALLPPETKDEGGRMKAESKDQPKVPASSSILHLSSLPSGTYELHAEDDVVPIAPGAARIDSPLLDQVIVSAAMRLETSVAEGWTVVAEVNGEKLSESLIGERRVDHKNKISSYAFIGINVRPGINRITVTPISPDGIAGKATASTVYGRGPARRLEIITEKKELIAGGRESTLVYVRGFDQWNHPAADDQVLLEVSSGTLLSEACGKDHLTNPCALTNISNEQSSLQEDLISGSSLRVKPATTRADGLSVAVRELKLSLSGGEARGYLVAGNAPGNAELHAQIGQNEARRSVRLLPEMRSAILVGTAEATFGRAAPDREWQGIQGRMSSRMSFFFRGSIFGNNLLTLAYDSHRPFHRTAGRDRLYEMDPRDRAYPLFGDSSTRFEEARSNSKLYARLDRGSSFLMFGDFNPDQDGTNVIAPATTRTTDTRMLTGYSRNLTGIKLHLENARGDAITVTGARPNTAFARDVFSGGSFGFLKLSQLGILPGSETVVLEVRDRRSPEIVLTRETLSRSLDYNLDPNTGVIFLLRPISTFDYQLNLLQVVVTYEYSTHGLTSAVYTGRATKRFTGLGLRVGGSFVNQRQPELGPFFLGGLDVEKSLPHGGTLLLEWGISRGRVAAAGNLLSTDQANGDHDGQAYRAELTQPLPFSQAILKASVTQADPGFLNPFGATVTPGSRRAVATLDLKVRPTSILRFGVGHERNKTENVDNQRLTASVGWTEQLTSRLRLNFGYDFRKLSGTDQDEISSHLFTIGGEWRPTEKLTFAAKREQNLGKSDPTYPNQTTLSASYQINTLTRLFFTQRLASAPIVPISDVSKTGFAATNARNEMAFGVETKLGRFTTANSRYQIENGINGNDSFAVIGLANKLPISKTVSLEVGFERGQHVTGPGASFNSGSFGFFWLPTKNFRSAARYEMRDRNGFGQAITLGAAGKLGDDITTLGSIQWAKTKSFGRSNSTMSSTAALAFRPLHSDRAALLFAYNRRSLVQDGGPGVLSTIDRSDTLSSDALLSLTRRLDFYGRVAVKSGEDGRPDLARVSTLTYMAQGRLQQRLSDQFDVAAEFRWLAQPVTGTRRTSLGTELGYWVLPDLRLGAGYNFTGVREPLGNLAAGPNKSGFYFTISSKLSNLFNLFGNSQIELLTTGGQHGRSDLKDKK
jgi:uncharacterized repeat protein (TIGR01451 family)